MATENRTRGKGQGARGKETGTASTEIFYITNQGYELARRIQDLSPDSKITKFTSEEAKHQLPLLWKECRNIIFIMAVGIVVRTIAPLLKDKKTDPAVVVLDENGEFVISLLSGHIGGANALAKKIADHLGARAVITTASDVQGRISLDLWAEEHNLFVEDSGKLRDMSARIVKGGMVRIFSELAFRPGRVPVEFTIVDDVDQADIIISNRQIESKALLLRPRNLIAGIGCNRGTRKEEIESAVAEIMRKEKLSPHSIACIASIDLKRDEQGLLDYTRDNNLKTVFFSADELNHVSSEQNLTRSEAVVTATGAAAVAEPAALMGAGRLSDDYELIVTKQKRGNVTLAIAKAEFPL